MEEKSMSDAPTVPVGGHKTLLHCAIQTTIGGAWLQVSGWQSKSYEKWSHWTRVLWTKSHVNDEFKLLNDSEILRLIFGTENITSDILQ